MAFPEAPRVLYQKNPLVAVVLQLRFPTILRIDTEIPVAFQERIRNHYPIFQQQPAVNIVQPSTSPVPVNVQFDIRSKAYNFMSADKTWIVSLTRDALSITASQYVRWEDFKAHFDAPLRAFIEIYSPYNFSRIGLRYQDVIKRSVLGLGTVAWSELLKPHIAGVLSSPEIEADVVTNFTQISVSLGKNGQVQINHGFVVGPGATESYYLIDSDFYTNGVTETDHVGVTAALDMFNEQSRYLFRWCITERLHKAMEPQSF